ncbi:tRNA lysidine(34) synthetase TilS [Rhodobacteraceae bacterium KMM 6894]|nr:tRNA lysidine(34) synthetase TilS [Rhodobacteraceae bacterium KMM 6894]
MTSDGVGAITAAIAAHFPPPFDRPIVVAVSGGSDSLALLHALSDWGGAPLLAVTVDHRLRAEAAGEAAEVAAICARMNIPHQTLIWSGWDGTGNLSASARTGRYALMADWALAQGARDIALGHTQDDQAETLLMRLARRAGIDGLAGMAARREMGGVTLHRPLLSLSRTALRDSLQRRDVAWIDDPSNADGRYRRVQARRALSALAPVGVTADALADVAAYLGEARATLGYYATQEARALVRFDQGDIVMAGDGLTTLRPDIARRILQTALRWITGAGYGARGPDLYRLMDTIAAGQGATLAGCRITQARGEIRIAREYAALQGITAVPGALWDGRWQVDGPDQGPPDAIVAALGPKGRAACPEWRASGLPAHAIEATPALWQGDTLLSAPLAGYANGWSAYLRRDAQDFYAMLLSH